MAHGKAPKKKKAVAAAPAPSVPKRRGFTDQEVVAAVAARDQPGTPRIPLEAFTEEALAIAGRPLYPMNVGVMMYLERIKSPLVVPGAAAPTLEDMMKAVYALSFPPERIEELMSLPVEAFHVAAWKFAAGVQAAEILAIAEKIQARLDVAFSTAIGGGEKKAESPGAKPPGSAGPSS